MHCGDADSCVGRGVAGPIGVLARRNTSHYPSLTLANVYAALAYFYDNRAEIEKTAAEDERFAEEMHRKLGPGPLEQKLAEQDERAGSQ